jgi:hypothetical protein
MESLKTVEKLPGHQRVGGDMFSALPWFIFDTVRSSTWFYTRWGSVQALGNLLFPRSSPGADAVSGDFPTVLRRRSQLIVWFQLIVRWDAIRIIYLGPFSCRKIFLW